MRKTIAMGLLVLTSCGPADEAATTTSTTAPAPVPTTTTTLRAQPFEVQDCQSPPVTFSSLCQAFELLGQWHADRPIDAAGLAAIATDSIRGYVPTEFEEPPRTLFCAVPDAAFEKLCDELAHLISATGAAPGPAVDAAVEAMVGLGTDAFTYYVPPDQVGAFRSNGIVGGIGVLLDARDAAGSRCALVADACPLTIVFVVEDNPGAAAGLLAGDEIVAIEGQPVTGMGFTAAAAAISGNETGSVSLTVVRDGQTLELDITRARLSLPTVTVGLPEPGVGYIRIPDFEADVPGLVGEALEALEEFSPSTIVIDVRDNPGGLIDSVVEVVSEFVDGGPVLATVGPDETVETPASEGGKATSQQLVVIINSGTASSAEILAAALRERRGAFIVGRTSFGKDAVQIPFDMRNGGELHITISRWATPGGITVGAGGLSPDHDLDLPAGMSVEELVSKVMEAAS